jgi:hypothetical protein
VIRSRLVPHLKHRPFKRHVVVQKAVRVAAMPRQCRALNADFVFSSRQP